MRKNLAMPGFEGAVAIGSGLQAVAGKNMFITETGKNTGGDDFFQAKAIFHNSERLFDGLTFPLGRSIEIGSEQVPDMKGPGLKDI